MKMARFLLPLALVLFLLFTSADAAVDRGLRTYEDSSYARQNVYYQTGSTIYVRTLGTAWATNPVFYVVLGGIQIEVGLTESPPGSGIYKGSFRTDPVVTDDEEDVMKTHHNAVLLLKSDVDRDGVQGTTDVLNVTMDDQPPLRPRLTEVNATPDGSIRVNWTKYGGTDFRHYTVIRALDQNFSSGIDLVNITDIEKVEWIDPEYSVLSGVPYWYGVRVVDMAWNPSTIRPADSSIVAFNDTKSPSTVVGLAASMVPDGGNSILLTWNRSLEPDVVGYLIYHAIDRYPMWIDPMSPSERRYNPLPARPPPQPSDLIAFKPAAETEFLHEGLSSNYDHYYAIIAIDEEENPSRLSAIVGNTSDDTIAPGPPARLSISQVVTVLGDVTGYLNLTWEAPAGEEVFKYSIYRSTESRAQQFWLPFATTQSTNYVDKKVEHGKTYFYVVRSQDVAGNEENNSVEIAMTSVDQQPPSAPRNLRARDTDVGGRIRLEWTYTLEQPAEYRIYRSNVSGGQNFSAELAIVSRPYYVDRTVEDGVIYYYVVRSVDAAGNIEENRNEIAVMSQDLTEPFPAKSVFAGAAKGGAISVVWMSPWDDVEDPDIARQMRDDLHHYNVYWNTYDGFKPSPSKMMSTTENSVRHQNVTDGVTYYYIVRSVDHVGNENTDDPKASATADTSPPGSPTGLKTFRLPDGRLKLDWDAPPGEPPYRYNIYRARNSGGQRYDVLPHFMTFDETEWIDENVTHGQWYYYVVRSADFLLNEDQNTNEVGNFSDDRMPPGAPTEVVLTKLSGGDIMVNWTEPLVEAASTLTPREADMAVLYRVYSSTTPGGQNFSRPIYEDRFLYFIDRGLRDNQDYYFVVRALDAAGNEDQNRAEIKETADASPPLPPVNVVAQRSPRGEIVLSWEDPDGEAVDEYRIYRFIGNQTKDFTTPFRVTRKNEFVDNDVAEVLQYRYVVRSVDKAGNEGRNTIETLAPVLLGPPRDLVATPERDGAIRLTWKPPVDGTESVREYNIYRSLVPGQEQLGVPWDTSLLTTWADTDRQRGAVQQFMVDGTRYYYTVRAVDLYGNEGMKSEEVSAVSDRTPPNPPRNLEAIAESTGDIQLRWQTPQGERVAAYRIYRSIQSGIFNFNNYVAETSRIIHSDTGLVNGRTYYYVVRALDEAGNEEQNTREVVAVAFDRPPNAPISLRAQVRPEGSIVLTWNRPGGEAIAHYNVYRALAPDQFNFNEIYTGVTVTTFTDEFVENGRTYYYIVRSVDSTGNEEENQNRVQATSLDTMAPQPPRNLVARPYATGAIRLTWQQPPGEIPTTYRIYRSELPFFQPGLQYFLNHTSGTSYIDRGLPDSKTYYYVVRSVDALGNEDSNLNRVDATTPPSPPADFEANGNDKGEIVLIWRVPQTPVQSFRLYRSTVSGQQNFSQPIAEIPYPTTSYIDSGLNHSETYYYVARSVDAQGGEETNTVEAVETAMELVPPLAPSEVNAIQLTSGGIRLEWNHRDSLDVSVFRIYKVEGAGSALLGLPIAETNLTYYEDMETVSGVSYSYVIRAVDIHGNEEDNTNWIRTIALDVLAPEAPIDLVAKSVSGGSIELTWTRPREANLSFNVYRSTTSGARNATRVATTNTTLYLDAGLVNGREYFYIVRSQDVAGNEESNQVIVSATASKGGPRALLALALVVIFVVGVYVVDRRRRVADAESARA